MGKKFLICMAAAMILVYAVHVHVGFAANRGGTLRIALGTDPGTLDVHKESSLHGMYVCQNIFNRLIYINEKREFVPDLAQSWEILNNGKTYIFHLREGVKFHDGSDLTAEVVKWNFERVADPKTGSVQRPVTNHIESIKVVDPHTLRIDLKEVYAPFLSDIMRQGTGISIMSKAAYEKYGDDISRNPVGTGPFKLVEWVKGDHVTLVRNENYFKKGLPYLDKLIFRPVPDHKVRMMALRGGEIDFTNDVPNEMINLIKKDRKLKFEMTGLITTDWLNINMMRKPLDDIRVRQAISYAINRKDIADAVFFGVGEPSEATVPKGNTFSYDPKIYPPQGDVENAKKLLAEAGVNNLTISLLADNVYAKFPPEAEMIKYQLSKVGINVNVEVVEKTVAIRDRWFKEKKDPNTGKIIERGDFDMFLEDMEAGLDPHDYFLNTITGVPYCRSHVEPTPVDKWLKEGVSTVNLEARKNAYAKAQEALSKEAFYLTLVHSRMTYAMQKYVKGFPLIPHMIMVFENVWLEK